MDLEERFIRAVEVNGRGDRIHLLRVGSIPAPEGSLEQGRIKDEDGVARAVERLLTGERFLGSRIAMSLFSPLILVRKITLPLLPDSQIRRTLLWEAKSAVSFPLGDVELEYSVLRTTGEATPQMEVVYTVVPSAMVEERVKLAEILGLDLVAVDLEPFALQRALVDFSPQREGENIAILHTKSSYATMMVVERGMFALVRAVPISREGREETEERLVREMRRFLDFHIQEGGKVVDKVLLSGGGEDLAEVADFLGRHLALPCEVTSLERDEVEGDEEVISKLRSDFPLLALAYGTALWEIAAMREGIRT